MLSKRCTASLFALFLGLALAPAALAQQHGLSISKGCQSPRLVGQTVTCTVVISNTLLTDTQGDTHTLTAASDTVTNATGPGTTAPMAIQSIQNNSGMTTCAAGPTLPCDLHSGDSITFLADHYTIVATDPATLLDTATVTAVDECDGTPSGNCPAGTPLPYPAASATTVASCDVQITKDFDCGGGFGDGCSALETDNVTNRRVVTNMSSAGVELRNCAVTDTNAVIGNAGPLAALGFQESSAPIDVVDSCQDFFLGGEPDTANVACDCFVGGQDTGIDATDSDDSSLTCETCDVQITKLVDCGDGLGPVESCTGIQTADGLTGTPVTYSFEVQNLGTLPLTDCQVTDTNVVPAEPPTDIGVGATIPLNNVNAECTNTYEGINTINVDCLCGGTQTRVQASDTAELACVNCGATIDKQVDCGGGLVDVTGADDTTGDSTETCLGWLPFDGMPGEDISTAYVATDGSQAGAVLANCSLHDTNAIINGVVGGPVADLGNIGGFTGECTQTLLDAEGASNTATLTCDCGLEGTELTLAGAVVAQDIAGFDCQTPGLTITKTCEDQVGNINDFDITVTSTGDAGLINCEVVDTLYRDDDTCTNSAEELTLGGDPQPFNLATTGAQALFAGTATDLMATSCNNATVTCQIDDGSGNPVLGEGAVPKTISSTFDATCEVGEGCLTHTIGFWFNRTNFVDAVIDNNGGPLQVCGGAYSEYGDYDTEGLNTLLCDRGQDILHAQCAAAALNIAASNSPQGGGSCGVVEDMVDQYAACCGAPSEGDTECSGDDIPGCIETITAFNESLDTLEPFSIDGVDFGQPGPATGRACFEGTGPGSNGKANGKNK